MNKCASTVSKPSLQDAVLSKNFAERAVFNCIVNRFEVSAPELINYTGMPGSTVAGILSRLVARGLVTPNGTEIRRRGRPSIRYRVCIPRPVCSCQVEATQVSAAIFDSSLDLCGLELQPSDPIKSVAAGVDAVRKVVGRLQASLPKSVSKVTELALALNAMRLSGHRLVSSVLPWADASFEKGLAKTLGMQVRIVPFFGPLIAEKQKLQGQYPESIVRFQVGDGISAHMAFDGESYLGHSSLAGQLGHVTVDANGPICGCGRRGCLEAYCSGPALHKRLLEDMTSGVTTLMDFEKISKSFPRVSTAALYEAWKAGDSYARGFMRPVFERLAWSLGIIMDLIDPELILACGYLLANQPEWVEEILQRTQQWTLYSPSRPIPLVPGHASLEDELRVTGTLYFYQFSEYGPFSLT